MCQRLLHMCVSNELERYEKSKSSKYTISRCGFDVCYLGSLYSESQNKRKEKIEDKKYISNNLYQ